jgi:hypothetical protein
MSLSEQLRESRSKHTLKSYDAAVKQLRVFKAVRDTTAPLRASAESNRGRTARPPSRGCAA